MNRFFRRFGPNPAYERWRWQTFAITWLAYAGFNLTRMSFAVTKTGIEADAKITINQQEMALIDGAFLSAYAIGQLFWGVAGDRFGTRRVILVGMLCSVLAGFAMGVSSTVPMFAFIFLIQGLCQSSGWAPLVKNVGNFFSRRERGTILGLWCTNYAVGGMIASMFASFVAERLGWRFAFYVPAAVLLGIWVLFLLFQRDSPECIGLPSIESYHGEPVPALGTEAASGNKHASAWATLRSVLTTPMVLLLSLVYFCLKPTRYAVLFWGPKYIFDRLGTGMAEAGFLTSMFELAGPISILTMGVISDRVFGSRRMPVSVICLTLLALLLVALDHLPANAWVLGVSLFLLGFLAYASDAMIAGLTALDFGGKSATSTATGMVNCCGSIGALIGGVAPGLVHESWGWNGVFYCLAGAAFLAAILLLPKWNTVPAVAAQPAPAS